MQIEPNHQLKLLDFNLTLTKLKNPVIHDIWLVFLETNNTEAETEAYKGHYQLFGKQIIKNIKLIEMSSQGQTIKKLAEKLSSLVYELLRSGGKRQQSPLFPLWFDFCEKFQEGTLLKLIQTIALDHTKTFFKQLEMEHSIEAIYHFVDQFEKLEELQS